jgi:transcription antitermination factor NusB
MLYGFNGNMHDWHVFISEGGGMLYDWGVHLLDQLCWMFPGAKLTSVFADIRNVINKDVDDYFHIMLRFESGLVGEIELGTYYLTDRELWRKIYRTLIQNNPDLDALLEEQSLYWNDDKEVVDTFVVKTIKRFEEKNSSNQELLPEYDSEEDKDYARKLFRATIMNGEEYQRYMSEASRNWDFSRLAYMDIVIMQIAIAEMMTFPSIPISVSINEYVELAKVYSTPRSAGYINGMLDAIAHHLVNSGRLMKMVR